MTSEGLRIFPVTTNLVLRACLTAEQSAAGLREVLELLKTAEQARVPAPADAETLCLVATMLCKAEANGSLERSEAAAIRALLPLVEVQVARKMASREALARNAAKLEVALAMGDHTLL